MTALQTEVVVVGATSAGVCAAVAAAERGAATVLLEAGRHVGGMTSGGLGYTDLGDPRVLGGPARRLREAIGAHYGVPAGTYAGPEPHVAEAILVEWLERAGVDVRLGERVEAVDAVLGRVEGVTCASGSTVRAGVFVDATYEGDLLALAGVPCAVGREDRTLHGERFAGRQELVPGLHTMPPWISPFRDDPTGLVEGPLLPGIRPEPFAEVGSGDGGVMSYGYRVCLTQAADRIPFPRPEGYDEADWELGRRLFAEWRRTGVEPAAGRMVGLEPNLPNGKADGNSLGPFSLSVLDGSAWRYPLADPDERERIRLHHLRHAAGFLHFLATDAAVPAAVRREVGRWGLPRDEFADTGHLPHQLYVREARRMQGEVVLTERDLVGPSRWEDVVAMGSYHLDVREVQRGWRWVHEHPRPIGMVFTEGYLSVPVPPYPIPYRALLPRREDCGNLLAAVCVSASHVAFSSIRMEPQYQMIGAAAGEAAALAVAGSGAVHDVPVDLLQQRLVERGQVLAA